MCAGGERPLRDRSAITGGSRGLDTGSSGLSHQLGHVVLLVERLSRPRWDDLDTTDAYGDKRGQ